MISKELNKRARKLSFDLFEDGRNYDSSLLNDVLAAIDAHECKSVASDVPKQLRKDIAELDKYLHKKKIYGWCGDIRELLAIAEAKPEEKQPCWVVKLSDEVTDALSEEVVAAYKAIAESKPTGWKDGPPRDGVGIIAAERQKQIAKWPADHDDEHADGSLAVHAAILATQGTDAHVDDGLGRSYYKSGGWQDTWGLSKKHRGNDVKRLAISGALIAAEIDRVMRDNAEPPPQREVVVDCCGDGRQGKLIALIEKLVKHDSYLKCKEVIDVIEKFRAT